MKFEWNAAKGKSEVAGKNLEWQVWGPSPDKAPTIIMLHEGLGCLALWRDFPAKLSAATGLGVLAYSRAGYGLSDHVSLPRPLDYMQREAKDVLPHLLEGWGLKKGILLGHSDGASIAACYAGGVQDHRIRGLILMAPHFFTEDMGLTEIAAAKTAFETTDLRLRMAKYHSDAEATFRGWNEAWLAPGFKNWNIAEVIDYFRVPVLAIQGLQDQYGTRRQIDEIVNRTYSPIDVVMVENCKHSPHLEQPEKTLAAINDYCARLARIEAAHAA